MTNGDILKAHGDRLGLPLGTLASVRKTLIDCEEREQHLGVTMARMMLRFGRLEDDAREFARQFIWAMEK